MRSPPWIPWSKRSVAGSPKPQHYLLFLSAFLSMPRPGDCPSRPKPEVVLHPLSKG